MTETLRMGLVGLGMMGRHHARILARLDDVEFVGACDPAGDPHDALVRGRWFESLDDLLEEGIGAAVVAAPTGDHETAAIALARSGVHMLVEKPVAHTVAAAEHMQKTFADAGLVAAVGHVERFNPALQELVRRLGSGQLGRVFSISTERVGPFPNRVRDIGVVKDLASHDIDLIRWIGGSVDRWIGGSVDRWIGGSTSYSVRRRTRWIDLTKTWSSAWVASPTASS